MTRIAVLFFALTGVAAAQDLQLDVGVRGGLLANSSYRANQLCSGVGCAIGTRSFTTERMRGTVGPTVGVVYSHLEVRFEAVRRRFGYEVEFDLDIPGNMRHTLDTVRGHLWEYPLLGTYNFGTGTTRAFAGGGVGLGTSGSYTSVFQSTTTLQSSSGPITTTTTETQTVGLRRSTPYYVIGGVSAQVSSFTIRPEFRYSRFPDRSNSSATAILRPNQFEFLVGFTFNPIRRTN
jgi:hypothetical protein